MAGEVQGNGQIPEILGGSINETGNNSNMGCEEGKAFMVTSRILD